MKNLILFLTFIVISVFALAQIYPASNLEKRIANSDGIHLSVPEKTSAKENVHWSVTFEEEEPVWTFGWNENLQEKSWHVTDYDGIPQVWGNNTTGWYILPLGYFSETGNINLGTEDEPDWVADGKWAWVDILGDHPAFGGTGQSPLNSWIQFDNIDLTGVTHPKLTFYQMFRPLNQVRSYIDFSTDGGNTWTEVRINSNVASNAYADVFFDKYIGNYVANEPNVSIRFRWQTISVASGGSVGYGWQIDDIKITDNPQYDIKITDTRMNFFEYYDYHNEDFSSFYHKSSHYGQVPVAQYNSENALCWFNVAVENKGYEVVTPMLNVQVIDPKDNIIFDETMSGSPLSIFEKSKDTLDMILPDYNFELGPNPMTGLYSIIYEVFINGEEDEFPADNVQTAFFYVTEDIFGRDAKVPKDLMGSIGPTNWVVGGEDGDRIATEYMLLYETEIKSIDVFIHEKTDVGTAFIAKIMHYDDLMGGYVDIATSTLITIEEEHIDSWVTAELIGGGAQIMFEDGAEYKSLMIAIEIYYLGQDNFFIGTDSRNNYSAWGALVYFETEASWFLGRETGVCIRLNTGEPAPLSTITSIDKVDDISVCQGKSEKKLISELPKQTTIHDSDENTHSVDLTWEIEEYDEDVPGEYTATGTFKLPYGVGQSDPATDLVVTCTITVLPTPQQVELVINPEDGILLPGDYGSVSLSTSYEETTYWTTKGGAMFSGEIQGTNSELSLGDNYEPGTYDVWSSNIQACIILQGSITFAQDDNNNKIIANVTFGTPPANFPTYHAKVSLFKKDNDINEEEIILVEEKILSSNGYCEFSELLPGKYFLGSFMLYPENYNVTSHVFYVNALTHEDATEIEIEDNTIYIANIHHVLLENNDGSNHGGGSVNQEEDEDGKKSLNPLEDMVVILRDMDIGTIIDVSVTNNQGEFYFENIPDNTNIQMFVTSIEHQNWTPYTVTTETEEYYQVNFIVSGNSIYPEKPVNIHNNEITNLEFNIFPNPTKHILHVENLPEQSLILIYNIKGNLIIKEQVSYQKDFDVSNFSSGIYMILVSTEDGEIGVKRFVKE